MTNRHSVDVYASDPSLAICTPDQLCIVLFFAILIPCIYTSLTYVLSTYTLWQIASFYVIVTGFALSQISSKSLVAAMLVALSLFVAAALAMGAVAACGYRCYGC